MDIHLALNVLNLLILLILAVEDLKTKRISVCITLIYVAAGFVGGCIYYGGIDIVLTLILGGVFILVSGFSQEKIGYGDSLTILGFGLWRGLFGMLQGLFVGSLLSGICSVCYILRCRLKGKSFDKDKRIAFIPFLLLGAILGVICEEGLMRR